MKRVNMILVMLILIASQMTAQLVRENEAAIVYYMPKNELCLTLDYSIIEQTPGVFYQYAERYLGTKDVIKASQTSYILNSLSANLVSTADTERAYKITATQSVNELLISLTQDGRLLGYNIGLTNEIGSNDAIKSPATHTCSSITEHELMPLLEEQFIVSSVAKMAEGAAKQIYRIRETRLNLLAGEVEHVPADGEAMKLVLAELDHQEKLLTELFVGKKTVTHKTHTLSYIPIDNTENEIVCRFSVHSGVVAVDDLSGEPIYLNVQAKKQELGYIAETNSKAPALSQLYYNIPGEGKIHITYKGKDLLNASYPIAQWGMAGPMNKQLFMGRQSVTIHINPETGNILSIQQ
jgi:hypothetical protein